MSLEHSSVTPNPLEALSELLKAKPGDDVSSVKTTVALASDVNRGMVPSIFCEEGARDPRVNTMFQSHT